MLRTFSVLQIYVYTCFVSICLLIKYVQNTRQLDIYLKKNIKFLTLIEL